MSARKIVAGNWKMNLLPDEADTLVNEVLQKVADAPSRFPVEVFFFVPYPYIIEVSTKCNRNNGFYAGSQTISSHHSGAYTGEVSAAMVKACGAAATLIGHSERRQYHREGGSDLVTKMNLALSHQLTPVWCCGEQLQHRESGLHFETVKAQLDNELLQLDKLDLLKCVIAYEPVWAIGTGKTATPAQAQEMHAFIRNYLREKLGETVSAFVPLLYGGSCNASNAAELFSQPDIDGGLIGGASLKANDFVSIIEAACA
jgi:triosephosphate isomerase (TIM)